jgi:putative transcription factor
MPYYTYSLTLVGSNTRAAQSTEGQRLTKIDRENEVAPPPKVDMSVGKAIAKARAEKTPPLKQSDLAQKINEKPSVINGMHFLLMTIADDRL